MGFLNTLTIFWWLGAIGFAAWLAREKGRDALGWGLLAILFGPLVMLALIGAPRKEK